MADNPQAQTANEPLTEAQQAKVHAPVDPWADPFALKVAKQDFEHAANYRARQHDWRWRNADEIYLAWVAQKHWDGTRIPRSSLGVYTALEQVESLLPRAIDSLFADSPAWFQVAAQPGTSADEARGVRDLLLQQMEENHIRETLRRVFKSSFVYGNGIAEVGWKFERRERIVFTQFLEPVKRNLPPPFNDVSITVDVKRIVKDVRIPEIINRPFVNYVSLKDFYIDPNCPSPLVQEARYAAKRSLLTIDELELLRNEPGIKLPPPELLAQMAKQRPFAEGDRTKESSDLMRQGSWQASLDTSVDPSSKRVEVISYWTRDRLVWLLNREWVGLNIANPYGFIPFFNAFYVDVLDRFYALAVTDVIEGEQRMQQSVINARLDELALGLHPARIKRLGMSIPSSQLRRRPGQVIEAQNPREDIVTEQVQDITASAYLEVDASERRAQKVTGITDLTMTGAPSARGNPALRTATGVGVQAQASFSRVQYLVGTSEDNVIEPLLTAFHSLNVRFLPTDQIIEVLGEGGKVVRVDPLRIKNASVKFSMRASSKMQARMSLLQSLPLIYQTFLNPAFMELLAKQQGKTVNVDELAKMLLDATGYRQYKDLFIPLSPEQQRALNQPPPEETIRMQMQRERLAAQGEQGEEERIARIAEAVVKQGLAGLSKSESKESAKT